MHNRFLEEWRKRAIVRISVVLRTRKGQAEQQSSLIYWKGYREGFIWDSLPAYLADYGSAQQKDHYPTRRSIFMRYSKLLRFTIVMIILISHGINPFAKLGNILPMMQSRLNDREKEYIISTCLHQNTAECMRQMIYG